MDRKVMKCGHAANGTVTVGDEQVPCCVVCATFGDPKAQQEAEQEEIPGLEGRKAHCSYGGHNPVDSSYDLAFFEHRPELDHDYYYCGCHGWD